MASKALKLWRQIRENISLEEMEKDGLFRGEERGKKPDVSFDILVGSLSKQMEDCHTAIQRLNNEYYLTLDEAKTELKKCLADLRNVAGIMFLRLEEAS